MRDIREFLEPFVLFLLVVLVALALVITGACSGSPTAPSPSPTPDDPPPHPADSPIYSVSLPGSSKKFWWWVEEIDPSRGSQLVLGQMFEIKVGCKSPAGYSFMLRQEFSRGPGTEPIKVEKLYKGPSSNCALYRIQGLNDTIRRYDPDLLYVRFSVWVQAGEDSWQSMNPGNRPPDLVVNEYIGFTVVNRYG